MIEGGGQNDIWHGLQCKGKYSGDIRIELTYYDTRPKSEAAVERRKEVEKAEVKSSSPAPHTLSGPRQPKPVKRRPLPADPTGASSSRPAPPEQVYPAPAREYPHPPPARPAVSDNTRPSSRGSVAPGPHMRPVAHDHPHQAPLSHGQRVYDTPSNLNRPRASTNSPHHANNVPPHQSYPRDNRGSFPDEPVDMYDSRSQQVIPAADPIRYSQPYSQPQAEFMGGYQPDDYGQPQDARADAFGNSTGMPSPRNPYETPPRQNAHNAATPEHHRNSGYPSPSQRPRNSPYTTPNAYGSSPQEIPQARSAPGSGDRNGHYHRYSTSPSKNDVFRDSPLRNSVNRADFQPPYGPMQPQIEDDDEGPPPPPPAHREGVGQSSHHQSSHNGARPVPMPDPSGHPSARTPGNSPGRQPQPYAPYQVDARSVSPSTERDPSYRGYSASSQTSYNQPRRYPSQDFADSSNEAAVPPSLVAGYDPTIADAESERMMHENNSDRRRSYVPLPAATSAQPVQPRAPPAYQMPLENAKPPPPTVEDAEPQDNSMALAKQRSVSPDTRGVPARKSVSPRPSVSPKPTTAEEPVLSGIPFSPDSFDALNPNVGNASAVQPQGAPYETPEQALETARQREVEKLRDVGPIIGNDGRVIDPTDHLPTDTWAPEPERKGRKPEVVVRFKNAPQSSKAGRPRDSEAQRPQSMSTPSHASHRHSVGPQTADSNSPAPPGGRNRLQKQSGRRNSYIPPHVSDTAITPPRSNNALRERENFAAYDNNGNKQSTSPYYSPQQNSRPPTSHSPSSGSYYHSNTGPPIPAKVPIHPGNQNYPVYSGGGGDALSEEMRRIDIGTSGPPSSGGRTLRRPM